MLLTPINPPSAAWPGVSQGMILKGNGIFVSTGHVGVDEQGNVIDASLEDQVVALFESLGRTLKAASLGFEHVARMTTYVTDFESETVDTIRRVRSRYFNADAPPASVMIGVAALYDPRLRVEAEIIAVVP
ncbi:MAG: RidA family protein [Parvibaculaceae bacterium]